MQVHIFWEGHKILRNLYQLFDWQYIGQIIGGDFPKFCGLLKIYELYNQNKIIHTEKKILTKGVSWSQKDLGVEIMKNVLHS